MLALPWGDVENVHGVNLLKSTAVGFAEEEVDYDCTSETAGGEDITVSVVDGRRDVRCD